MDLGGLNNHQVHDFARFHAAAAAPANGCRHVEVSGPQTRLTIDGRTVQVSSRRQPGSPGQVSAAHPVVDDAAAVIFVDLTGDVPDFYIAPAQWVRSDVKSHFATWLESRGGVRPRNPESDHSTVELDRTRPVIVGVNGGRRSRSSSERRCPSGTAHREQANGDWR